MVAVAGRFCIDRFESRLFDAATGLPLSPDYAATASLAEHAFTKWAGRRRQEGDLHARALPLPPLLRPRQSSPAVVARSLQLAVPSGYATGFVAEKACQAAGKRVCTLKEFATACRGEQDRKFPYGDAYEHGVCNVYRYAHPAGLLHNSPSVGHLDPRLNRVLAAGSPLLLPTGSMPRCRSQWGNDGVYDLVGNLDEWVAEKGGAFAGGFYARATKAGCDALISVHPKHYLDYSLGVRCCRKIRR